MELRCHEVAAASPQAVQGPRGDPVTPQKHMNSLNPHLMYRVKIDVTMDAGSRIAVKSGGGMSLTSGASRHTPRPGGVFGSDLHRPQC